MKVNITCACGHEQQIDVFGKASDREYATKRAQSRVCSDCYKNAGKAPVSECEAVEMHYGEYKNDYTDCRTGAYNAKTKTITVYVPVGDIRLVSKQA